jgi:hypothetical protein
MPEFIHLATNKTNHKAKSYHQGRKDNLGHMNFPEQYSKGYKLGILDQNNQ